MSLLLNNRHIHDLQKTIAEIVTIFSELIAISVSIEVLKMKTIWPKYEIRAYQSQFFF